MTLYSDLGAAQVVADANLVTADADLVAAVANVRTKLLARDAALRAREYAVAQFNGAGGAAPAWTKTAAEVIRDGEAAYVATLPPNTPHPRLEVSVELPAGCVTGNHS